MSTGISSKAVSVIGGFSLVEVLVSLLVLSLGLLGVASSQLLSLEIRHGAYLRTQATAMAAGMLDAMRANPDMASRYVGVYPEGADGVNEAAACAATAGCEHLEMVWHDTARLARQLRGGVGTAAGPRIPDGRAEISAAAEPGAYTVRLTWPERVPAGGTAAAGLRTRSAARGVVELSAVIQP